MEDVDIEDINFDRYNREVYFDEFQFQRRNSGDHYIQEYNPQKLFKIELDKIISIVKEEEEKEKMEQGLERKKKRKF